MRDETVARNYAETLFELAVRNDALEPYGDAIDEVARAIDADPRFRLFLETPRIDDENKKDVIRRVFGDVLPRLVLNFVMVTIDKRRQRLLRDIARIYHLRLDEHMGREHVEVALARAVDASAEQMIAERLTAVLGKQAIPHLRVRPEILGGLVVRTGDTIYDGSVRRRLERMRRRLMQAHLPHGVSAEPKSDPQT